MQGFFGGSRRSIKVPGPYKPSLMTRWVFKGHLSGVTSVIRFIKKMICSALTVTLKRTSVLFRKTFQTEVYTPTITHLGQKIFRRQELLFVRSCYDSK